MTNTNYSTLTAFFNDSEKTVVVGDYVTTFGFSEVEDGGNGVYRVIAVDESLDNDTVAINGIQFTCKKVKLELCFDNATVRVNQFGAKKVDGNQSYTSTEIANFASINKNAIQEAINSGARKVEFSTGTYYVADDILINHPVDICGNGTALILKPTNTNANTHLFCFDFSAVENDYTAATNIKDLIIAGVTTNSISKSIPSIRMKRAYKVNIENVYFEGGDYAVYADDTGIENYYIHDISLINCKAINMNSGFNFVSSSGIKVKNCRLELAEPTNIRYGFGFVLDNSNNAIIEDVSVFNATMSAVGLGNNVWCDDSTGSGNATERILFKNLLIDNAIIAISLTNSNLPVSFNNAMLIDCDYSFFVTDAENISVTNSSVLAKSPLVAAADSRILTFTGYSKMKFMHTQFDFPYEFQKIAYNSEKEKPVDLTFVDCTLQKTDVPGLSDSIVPSGFGTVGYESNYSNQVIETFDACEFRSYINDYSVTTGEGENAVTAYNFPITLATSSNSGSKLIIKNCRFVNDSTCTVPYFKLDDSAKFDNIVVYNCFFENYDYSYEVTTDNKTKNVYPIFGRVIDGIIVTDITNSDNEKIHNIFARCNMRSYAPDGTNGTTINEVLEYN